MKGFLRSILDFLERKFPDKAVITTTDFKALKDVAARVPGLEERIRSMEVEINKFNVQMGFSGNVATPTAWQSTLRR